MASAREEVRSTLAVIESLQLPHPSNLLLSSFVSEALDPLVAARYVKDRLSTDGGRSLVSDWVYIVESSMSYALDYCYLKLGWCGVDVTLTSPVTLNATPPPQPSASTTKEITRRDGQRCCVSGGAGSLLDPLIVGPILCVPRGWLTEKVICLLASFDESSKRLWCQSALTMLGRSAKFLICFGPFLAHRTWTGGLITPKILLGCRLFATTG